jgi:hypothetical protein
MADRPKIENAPGLTWRQRQSGEWEARWRPRIDLVARGYRRTPQRLWVGSEVTQVDREWISDRCQALQAEMLTWGRGGIPKIDAFDGTIKNLCQIYQADPDSGFRELRYRTRQHYAYLCDRLIKDYGDEALADIGARMFRRWHEEWAAGGKISMGHTMITMLRIVLNFGATILEDEDCGRLAGFLHGMKFKQGKPRDSIITAEQVAAVCTEAHQQGRHSLALAQTLQYELTLRQRDVIGEWVPVSEPGVSAVVNGNQKWLRGLRWDEIDANLILRHTTSKRQKEICVDLKRSPAVMAEFKRFDPRPTAGAIVVNEATGLPYSEVEFRYQWRAIATVAGVPKTVRNQDSRAGAITEALEAGASLDSVRKAATHSDVAMTQRYSRDDTTAIGNVLDRRIAHRNKK